MKIWPPPAKSSAVFFQPPDLLLTPAFLLTGFAAVPTIYVVPTNYTHCSLMKGVTVSALNTVSFQHITRILEVTDELDISREAVEIPLASESPGSLRRLDNGKLEIVVDADLPFDDWLEMLPQKIRALMPEIDDPES